MKTSLNQIYSNNQNFGMAIHSNESVNKALKARIKTKPQIEKLNQLIEQANKNDKVDINLLIMPDGKTITANVYSLKNDVGYEFFKNYTENAFTKLFKGPVGFIEKLVTIADKKAKNIADMEAVAYDDILSKMK